MEIAILALVIAGLLSLTIYLVVLLLRQRASLRRYAPITNIENETLKLSQQQESLRSQVEALEGSKGQLTSEVSRLRQEAESLRFDANVYEFGLYEPKYNFEDSGKYRVALDRIFSLQKEMISADKAATCSSNWTVNGNVAKGRKLVEQQLKLMLLLQGAQRFFPPPLQLRGDQAVLGVGLVVLPPRPVTS